MFTALIIIKIIVMVWSLIFMICLYCTLKKFLNKIPTIFVSRNFINKSFIFKLGSKEIEISYRSE